MAWIEHVNWTNAMKAAYLYSSRYGCVEIYLKHTMIGQEKGMTSLFSPATPFFSLSIMLAPSMPRPMIYNISGQTVQ